MKNIHFLSILGLCLIGVSFGILGYWALEPDVITIKDQEAIRLDKTEYSKGDRITYTLEFCKRKQVPVVIYRSIVDSYRITYQEVVSNLTVGCRTIKAADLVIPEFIVGGGHTYFIDAENEVRVNPLKTQRVHWRSVDFRVE